MSANDYAHVQCFEIAFGNLSATFLRMAEKKSSPLQAAFWISSQEKLYILVICVLFLLGIGARYLYLGNRKASPPLDPQPEQVEISEQPHE